jgi:hypothetical protein
MGIIIESKGIRTYNYFLPPFTLKDGELVMVYLYSGAHFYKLAMEMADIFTGKTAHDKVTIQRPLTFVADFPEPRWRNLFNPLTVEKYLKNFNLDEFGLYRKTRINRLDNISKKLLSLRGVLSTTNAIVFDLRGLGGMGATEVFEVIKAFIKNGGSAILLDDAPDLKNECDKYVELEWIHPPVYPGKP